MADEPLTARAKAEHVSLQLVHQALNRLIAWESKGGDPVTKLPNLRLLALSFRRHLEGLIAVEGQGGFLQDVANIKPHLGQEVDALEREYEQFQGLIDRIVARLEKVAPTNRARLMVVTDELFTLANKLEEHDRKEIDLLQEAFLRDEGGEG